MREIKPKANIQGTVRLPGSKSYTQRALVIAALAEGESVLQGALISEDTELLMSALGVLGAEIALAPDSIRVSGTGGVLKNPGRELFLGNNGTALRFLTSLVCLGQGNYCLTGTKRLTERPVGPLQHALQCLGVAVWNQFKEGYPPVTVNAQGLPGGRVCFSSVESSQYISSLLLSAPYAAGDIEIELAGPIVSRPYIDLTVEAMGAFGVVVEKREQGYRVKTGQRYRGRTYPVEADLSAASYFFLAAALGGGRVKIDNFHSQSLQGDIQFLSILEELGCYVEKREGTVTVTGGDLLRGDYAIDMGDIPDLVPSLAVLAAFRQGRTMITNCSHLRLKESDRLAVLAGELNKLGVLARETEDGLEITGGAPRGSIIDPHEDHRIAMAFAVAGLALPGMKISDANCVKKSFPFFWEELERL